MNTSSTLRVGEQNCRLVFSPDLSAQLEDMSGKILLSFVRSVHRGCVRIVVSDPSRIIGDMSSEGSSWIYHDTSRLQPFDTLRPQLKDAVFLVSRYLLESMAQLQAPQHPAPVVLTRSPSRRAVPAGEG